MGFSAPFAKAHACLHARATSCINAIYLDANLPLVKGPRIQSWVGEVRNMLERFDKATAPFSCVTVTNFSWHYDADSPAGNPEGLMFLPIRPVVALTDPRTMTLLLQAAREYGDVPDEFSAD